MYCPKLVGDLVTVPGASGESPSTRLAAVYAAVAEVGIGYAFAASSDESGRQVIRSPAEVLWSPRHATCLDLALILAAAVIKTGLHPVVAILDPPQGAGETPVGHALVLVRLDRGLTPAAGGGPAHHVWDRCPGDVLEHLQTGWVGDDVLDGDWVAVDPVGVARSLGTATTRGLNVGLDTAVRSGAGYLVGDQTQPAWIWRVGLDLGATWRAQDTHDPGPRPADEPLRTPYRPVGEAPSPLRLLRAEYGLVPFQARDELTILQDWAARGRHRHRTGRRDIDGAGGAGKTRLALVLPLGYGARAGMPAPSRKKPTASTGSPPSSPRS